MDFLMDLRTRNGWGIMLFVLSRAISDYPSGLNFFLNVSFHSITIKA